MSKLPIVSTSSSGKEMHTSVGALICREGKYLLVDRAVFPFGWAPVAGHVDVGETLQEALAREVSEEVGLCVVRSSLLHTEEVDGNTCSKSVDVHAWSIFVCEVTGDVAVKPDEVKSVGWFSVDEILQLELEEVWRHFFVVQKLLSKI